MPAPSRSGCRRSPSPNTSTTPCGASSGKVPALEINTRLPLHATILAWWHDEGGDAVSFGSDAHLPPYVGHGFAGAARMAEAYGFRPGRHPYELWGRAG